MSPHTKENQEKKKKHFTSRSRKQKSLDWNHRGKGAQRGTLEEEAWRKDFADDKPSYKHLTAHTLKLQHLYCLCMQIHTNRGQRIALHITFPLSSVIYSIFFWRTLAHFVANSTFCNWKKKTKNWGPMTGCLSYSNRVWGWKKQKTILQFYSTLIMNSKNKTHLPFSSTWHLAKCWIELFSITCCPTNYLVLSFFFPTWFDNFVISSRLKKLAKLWQKIGFFGRVSPDSSLPANTFMSSLEKSRQINEVRKKKKKKKTLFPLRWKYENM